MPTYEYLNEYLHTYDYLNEYLRTYEYLNEYLPTYEYLNEYLSTYEYLNEYLSTYVQKKLPSNYNKWSLLTPTPLLLWHQSFAVIFRYVNFCKKLRNVC